MKIRALKSALRYNHIQFNGPTNCTWLVFDIDRSDAYDLLQDPHVPTPTIACFNPKNGHAHFFYLLKTPVHKAPDSSAKALRYCAAIERALCKRLGADKGYSGLVAKNPLHSDWYTLPLRSEGYELAELADWFTQAELNEKSPDFDYGLGYNCETFERLRHWAYRAIRQFDPSLGFDRWHLAVFERCAAIQVQINSPLPQSEVSSIAKSVAKWVYARMLGQGHSEAFIRKQTESGRKGGQCKGLAYASKRSKALLLRQTGISTKEISQQLGVSDRTIRNWLSGSQMEGGK